MRSATRLFAAVQQGARYLEAGSPTGLTGLATHGSPRTALLYLYSSTLETLKKFPEHSVYRQSTEALTKHRMSIVESIKPAGLEQWQSSVQSIVDEHPNAFRKIPVTGGSGFNIVWKGADAEAGESSGPQFEAFGQGPKTNKEVERIQRVVETLIKVDEIKVPLLEPEPSLTAAQVGEIESKISAGLIEEIIEVAEGENKLATSMLESQVWEDLDEKPVSGQWTYPKQDRGTAGTPPQN